MCGLIFLCKFLFHFKSSKYDTEHVGYMDHSQSVCALDQTFVLHVLHVVFSQAKPGCCFVIVSSAFGCSTVL